MGGLDKALRDRMLTMTHRHTKSHRADTDAAGGAAGRRSAEALLLRAYDNKLDVQRMPQFLSKLEAEGVAVEYDAWSRALALAAYHRHAATALRVGELLIQSGFEFYEKDYVSLMHAHIKQWPVVVGYVREMELRRVRRTGMSYAVVARAVRFRKGLAPKEKYWCGVAQYTAARRVLPADACDEILPSLVALCRSRAQVDDTLTRLTASGLRYTRVMLRAELVMCRETKCVAEAERVVEEYAAEGIPTLAAEWAIVMDATVDKHEADGAWGWMLAAIDVHDIPPGCYTAYMRACGSDVDAAEAKFAEALGRSLHNSPQLWYTLLTCYHAARLPEKFAVAFARMRLFHITPNANMERLRQEMDDVRGPPSRAPKERSPLLERWRAAAAEPFEDTYWKHGTAEASTGREPVIDVS